MTEEAGHNSRAAHDELEAFVARIERLQDEKKVQAQEYSAQIKEVFAEAKGRGYDTSAIREAIRLRAMDDEKRATVGFYADVLGVFG